MNTNAKKIKWSPEASAALDKMAGAAVAWQSGRTLDGRKLPWRLRLYAWFTGKLGHNVYSLYELERNNTRFGVFRALARRLADVVNKRWRLW